MGVDILVKRIELWIIGLDRFLDRGLETLNVQLRMRRQESGCAERGGRQKGFGKLVHGYDAP